MNTKESSFDKIRTLLDFKFEKIEPPTPTTKKVSAPAPTTKKSTIKRLADGSPDPVHLMVEVEDLKANMPLLSDYVSLKQQYNTLLARLTQLEQGFKAIQKEIKMAQTPESSKEVLQSAGLMTSKDEKLKKYFPK